MLKVRPEDFHDYEYIGNISIFLCCTLSVIGTGTVLRKYITNSE
jgi:hypothetical protein